MSLALYIHTKKAPTKARRRFIENKDVRGMGKRNRGQPYVWVKNYIFPDFTEVFGYF